MGHKPFSRSIFPSAFILVLKNDLLKNTQVCLIWRLSDDISANVTALLCDVCLWVCFVCLCELSVRCVYTSVGLCLSCIKQVFIDPPGFIYIIKIF